MDMREQIKKRFKKRRYAVLLTLFVGLLFFLLRGQFSHAADQIFIQFNEAEHRVNGRGGCNRFFGNYEMESSRLKFSPMGATRMACPDLQTETEFFQMLDGVDGYSIKDNKLSFLSKNKVVAVFKKAEEAK